MDALAKLGLGFSVAFDPVNLLFCFIGVLFGTLVGVLPGLGPVGAISLLLPLTFKLQPLTGIIMLAGVFYGAMYGGSTTSILVNIPGEAASIVTCIDGYKMARQGRAGPALGIAAFGSFIAGTVGIIGMMFFAPFLGQKALSFGAPEFFGLTFLGLTLVTYLSRGSKINALIMAVLGLIAGTIGADPVSGEQRFSHGIFTLFDGLGIVPVAMGMFGIAEVLENIEGGSVFDREVFKTTVKGLLPNLKDWRDSFWPIIRGSVLGFFIGILPGPGPIVAAFSSYAVEKKLSRHPERFGNGAIEGVAGPESANNSATAGAFIPLLSLGLPGNVVMALMMGALMIHGIQPGPLFISKYPDLFWGVIASMYLGNVMLLALNLPLIGMWVKILKIPYAILFPLIFLFCLIGVYTLNSNVAEIFIMLIFGVLGFIMRKIGFEGAPFLLALVLGPIMESSFRQALLISHGDLGVFLSRPVSAFLLILGFACLGSQLIPTLRKKKEGFLDKATREGG
jgi:putative tricarboxylic transport membrane protein